MTPFVVLLLQLAGAPATPPPAALLITTPRGVSSVPLTSERGILAFAAPQLAGPLGSSAQVSGAEATVLLGGATFRFTLGVPFVRAGDAVFPLAAEPYVARDTLFLPVSWLAEAVPRVLAPRFRWDAAITRLEERAPPPAAAAATTTAPAPAPAATADPQPPVATPAPRPAGPANPITGLRRSHTVVVDPGHGGVDPGNLGLYFPRGVTEKDINLSIGRLLRAELLRRGLSVTLTRSTDTLIDLGDRGKYCTDACDLFVSIHVNSMPAGRRQRRANGIETYFLSDEKTEDQKRVANMENEAMRFETDAPPDDDVLRLILRSLQANEYLRESARLADLVQRKITTIHPGEDRGVQQAAFMVLSRARRPAILVETGFSTNKDDAAFLASALGQRKIANAIADGIVAYLLEYERKVVSGGGMGR